MSWKGVCSKLSKRHKDKVLGSLSLGRVLQAQGRRNEARALLAPVYNWFTEGLDTLRYTGLEGGEDAAGQLKA